MPRASFAARGWDECLTVLEQLEDVLRSPDPEADPCLAQLDKLHFI